jgi:hypothetical protein
MNELNFGKLHIKIDLLKRQVEDRNKPYLDWLICNVVISLPNFEGQFRWFVMPSELESLAADLSMMYTEFPTPSKFTFEPVEPNIVLSFEITRTGHIIGNFAFYPDFTDEQVLKGSFDIDQSYLPGIVDSIRTLLKSSVDRIEEIGNS